MPSLLLWTGRKKKDERETKGALDTGGKAGTLRRYNYFPRFKDEESDIYHSSGTHTKSHSGKGQNPHLDLDQPTPRSGSSSS